ncbi:MAG: hypothetical protein ONB55_21705 [candidate division KSB1 bacterium]|nr:hypothetical protein [candidate division KSB1 bacterium]
MAITHQETVKGGITTGDSLSLTSWTPGANELVVVFIAQRDELKTVQSVTGNGITFSKVRDIDNIQGQNGLEVWQGMSANPSTGQITVTFSGNTKPVMAVACRFSGVDISTPIEVDIGNAGPSVDNANMKADITTLSDNAWAVAVGTHRLKTFTVPSGENAISINNSVGSGGDLTSNSVWYEAVASAGTVTLGADGDLSGADDWCMIVIGIKPAATTTYKNISGKFGVLAKVVKTIKTIRELFPKVAPASEVIGSLKTSRKLAMEIDGASTTVSLLRTLRSITVESSDISVTNSIIKTLRSIFAELRGTSGMVPFARTVRNLTIDSITISDLTGVIAAVGVTPLQIRIQADGSLSATFRVNRRLNATLETLSDLQAILGSLNQVKLEAAVYGGSVVDLFIQASKPLEINITGEAQAAYTLRINRRLLSTLPSASLLLNPVKIDRRIVSTLDELSAILGIPILIDLNAPSSMRIYVDANESVLITARSEEAVNILAASKELLRILTTVRSKG